MVRDRGRKVSRGRMHFRSIKLSRLTFWKRKYQARPEVLCPQTRQERKDTAGPTPWGGRHLL